MSKIIHAITRIKSLNSGSRPSSPASHISNGHVGQSPDASLHSVQVDVTNAQEPTAAQKQQQADAAAPPRPSTRQSFTEQKEERREEREAQNEKDALERKARREKLHQEDPLRDHYGDLPLNMSQRNIPPFPPLTCLDSIADMKEGDFVAFRARVHHIRPLGSKIVFIVFRQQLSTIQGVLTEEPDKVSQNMIRWAEGLSRETVVLVEGILQKPPPDQGDVHSATVHNLEVKAQKLFVLAAPTSHLPFQVEDVSRTVEAHERDDTQYAHVREATRLANRVLDLRSPVSHAIFRVQAAVCQLFRSHLIGQGFTEIHSSKFEESSTESGAEVFKVDYFRRPAFLAQSPQLAKQMCIAADMERVFEIGPVFRAENSNTHRHLTEFTGLDLEMAFNTNYHEVLDVIDSTLKYIFKTLLTSYAKEVAFVKEYYPSSDLVILDETPRLKFAEGIKMLKEAGFKEDDGSDPSELDDLSRGAETTLGRLVKEKYGADYYILDKFPAEARPFYTMPDPEDARLSNSYDIFLRGQEILSGGQRIHDAPMLEEHMRAVGIDPSVMKEYVDGFRWGCPPHGGGGIGLERVVSLFLNLGDIRWASLFPRDPRSFAKNGKDVADASMVAAASMILHGPESETWEPGQPHGEMPPLENLVAKYGDATNTSWMDPAWTVWRDPETAAAIGYIPQNGFAVTFGNPLCPNKQIPRVVSAYLKFLEEMDLKPVWCCVSKIVEAHLASEYGWSAVIAVAEERLSPAEVMPETNDKTVRRKIHRAEREGVQIVDVEVGHMDDKVKAEIIQRCKEWEANRKGTQIHLTGVRPFDDMAHRKYYYAVDKNNKICTLVVLAQLSAIHGFQIKWALEFPGAPLGAIEYILSHVIKKLGDAGVRSATFGAGATGKLERADNVGGFKIKTLEKTYNTLSLTLHLGNKGDFRSKFGAYQDPSYICWPKGNLGVKGIEAIMAVLQKPK